MNNIYFCHEKDDNCGLYICEKTRAKAKDTYAGETGCDFCDVRTNKVRRNVREKPCIIDVDNARLRKKYDLEYYDENGEVI